RIDRDPPGKRLETERRSRGERAADRALRSPPLSEPAEERSGHDAADQHASLADEEPADRRNSDVRVLDRAERHQRVAEKPGICAGKTEQRRAARHSLSRAGDEREDEPRRRQEADFARPAGCPDVPGAGQAAEVLVAGTESG